MSGRTIAPSTVCPQLRQWDGSRRPERGEIWLELDSQVKTNCACKHQRQGGLICHCLGREIILAQLRTIYCSAQLHSFSMESIFCERYIPLYPDRMCLTSEECQHFLQKYALALMRKTLRFSNVGEVKQKTKNGLLQISHLNNEYCEILNSSKDWCTISY